MGGPSGEVGFPQYIEDFHDEMLSGGGVPLLDLELDEAVNRIYAAGNPYTGVTVYDPSGEVSLAQDRVDAFTELVDALDMEDTWDDAVAQVLTREDDLVSSDDTLDDDVDHFEQEQEDVLARAYNRVAAEFFDVNAVVSTAFPTALAILESEHGRGVAQYRTKATFERGKERTLAILQGIQQEIGVLSIILNAKASAAGLQDQSSKFAVQAFDTEIGEQTQYDLKESFWELEVLKGAGDVLRAVSGIPAVPDPLTPFQQFMSGAFNWASLFMGRQGNQMSMVMGMLPFLGL